MNGTNKVAIFIMGIGVIIGGFYWWGNHSQKTIPNDNDNCSLSVSTNTEKIDNDDSKRFLHSFFNHKEDYLEAFARCDDKKKINFIKSPKAGIVSHHFLAKDSIACFFDNFPNKNEVKTIILIGPDHFHSFSGEQSLFFTTKLPWTTPFGNLSPEKRIIDILLNNKLVVENNSVFQTEHSIYTEIPFIKKTFPKAKIVPLIVKNNFDYDTFQDFGQKVLAPLVEENSLILISSDFTHHSTNKEARQVDKKSLKALENLSIKVLPEVTSDCRACLALLYGCLLEKDDDICRDFKLFANQNSTDFGGEDSNVTSYIFGYY